MHIHEYQAKELLQKYGIPSPPFKVASSEKEVKEAILALSLKEAVVKVQIHAGGRGKAGGIKFGKNKEEILAASKELIGKKIVNNQTGPLGLVSEKVMITSPVKIKKEYYVAALIDRSKAASYLIASKEGGMEIEEVAQKNPQAIFKEKIDSKLGLRPFQLIYLAKKLGWEKDLQKKGIALLRNLARLFVDSESTLFEINPLVETEEGELLALDAKCTLDENAFFRHKEFEGFFDPSQHTKNEVLASQYGLSYVGLEGNIGCMVNGAGLAMATMDILNLHGGKAANFLDVGGSADLDKITKGFKMLLNDPQVKVIFVNIFGGIMDCALIAEGIVTASKEQKKLPPLVVRLEGTNVEKGRKILADSKLNLTSTKTMDEGAAACVKLTT